MSAFPRNLARSLPPGVRELEGQRDPAELAHSLLKRTQMRVFSLLQFGRFAENQGPVGAHAVILDTRSPAEYAASHLTSAKVYNLTDDATSKDVLATKTSSTSAK